MVQTIGRAAAARSRPASRPPAPSAPRARPRLSSAAPTRPANPARTIRNAPRSGRSRPPRSSTTTASGRSITRTPPSSSLGIPVAYLPYFWTPDPTVKRKTGLPGAALRLSRTRSDTARSIPFFWAIAPNYDLTITPTFLSRQGVLGQVEWRHRLETGAYNIRAAGIIQREPEAFLLSPYGAGDRDFRGSLEIDGPVLHQRELALGLGHRPAVRQVVPARTTRSAARASARTTSRNRSRPSILQGQGDRSFFDVRGYYFQTLSTQRLAEAAADRRSGPRLQQALHAPDHRRRVRARRERDQPVPRGGAVRSAVPVANTTYFGVARDLHRLRSGLMPRARHQRLDLPGLGRRRPGGASSSTRSVRSGRLSPICGPTISGSLRTSTATRTRSSRTSSTADDDYLFRVMPAVGLEYRFPFIGSLGTSGQQILEPIAQIIARPNETRIGQPSQRGCPEPRVRRHVALRLGQVLRLRPGRGRRARQCRRAVHRHRRRQLLRQRAVRPVLPGRGPQLVPSAATSPMWAWIRVSIRGLPIMSAASRSRRTRTLLFVTRGAVRPGRFRPEPVRSRRSGELQPLSAGLDLADLCALRGAARHRLPDPPRGPARPRPAGT